MSKSDSPVPSFDTSTVRDVENEATTNGRIAEYIRRNDRPAQEILKSQLRLRRRWEHDKIRLRAHGRMTPEERAEWQLETVRTIVNSAYATVPFYRELYSDAGFEPGDIITWSDFEQLPIVDKRMLVESGVSAEIAGSAKQRALHSVRTSGSSGLDLTIHQDNESLDYRAACNLWHCELLVGHALEPDDWRYSVYFKPERLSSLLGAYPVVTVSHHCPPRLLIEHIAELRPKLLMAYPSYLQRLAEEKVALDLFGVEAICTNSERSTRGERLKYSKIFRVPVLDEYSSNELSLIAYECRERRYHLVENNVYAEVPETDDEGFGRLIGTSLGNLLMPFIRYDQGDVVRLEDPRTPCACGSSCRVISAFRGREGEHLLDGPLRTVPADVVLDLCDKTLLGGTSHVQQYQVAQTAPDRIEVRLSRSDPTRRSDEDDDVGEFTRILSALFVNETMRVDVVYDKEFATLPSGKRCLIYREGPWDRIR
ncbi:phenylacetate--CoA ligase family protein [Streptosporangium roseum]|uniref:phenylacetate--CoA ligase family protein n=1 Tax=Streptosporangium roseum TaxID=2001 RepID=UPI00332D8AB5